MRERFGQRRRQFLAAAGAATATTLSGCMGILGNDNNGNSSGSQPGIESFRGSGEYVSGRPAPGGTSIEELDDLEGKLTVYLGGGEGGRYINLLELLNQYYDDFEVTWDTQPSSQLANTIVQEYDSGTTQADVFWSVDIGSLAYVSQNGASTTLSSDTVSPAFDRYHPDDTWVGVAGRSRAIPYNTNQFSESEMPDSIDAFTTESRFAGSVGWAPTYGAFHSFITAMRSIRGDDATREWLNGMLDQNVNRYANEYLVAQATSNGELATGFANHYYTMLVLAGSEDAPIDVTFTKNDAGSLVNAAGASVLKDSGNEELAENFIRHLLSAEAQEFFATRGFGYPMIPGVEPVGPLPSLSELEPPELDFQELSNIQPTLDLLREVGILS
jgi:iron(III) transport system substrate-binding protein